MNCKHFGNSHMSAARCLAYGLSLGDFDGWQGASEVWSARLTYTERASIAWAALKALPSDQIELVANAALPARTGPPIAPLFGAMDEAAFWADMADPAELEAYMLACFNRLSPERQSAFLSFVERRNAA